MTGTAASFNPSPSGPIYALHVSNSLVAGGDCLGFGGAARTRFGSVSLATGLPTTWNPVISSAPTALLWGNGTLFAGGSFASVASVSHRYLAAWNTSTNALLALDPVPDGAISALALMNDTLFVGGAFSYIAGSPRRRLAALSASASRFSTWIPGGRQRRAARGRPRTLRRGGSIPVRRHARPRRPRRRGPAHRFRAAVGSADGRAGQRTAPARRAALRRGQLLSERRPGTHVRGGVRHRDGGTVSVGARTGRLDLLVRAARRALLPRRHVLGCRRSRARHSAGGHRDGRRDELEPGTNGTPIRLAIDSDTLFVGGAFSTAGGQPRGNAASFDAASGALTPWNPAANNQVTAFEFQSGQVFVGGAFTSIGGATRSKLALLSRSTGLATPWNAGVSSGASYQVDVLDLHNGQLFVGGAFSSVANGAAPRSNLALLNAATAAPIAWAPEPWPGVHALLRDRGTLHVGGFFTNIAGVAHPYYVALLDPTYQLELLDAPAAERPSSLALATPFPNPAQARTRLAFTLPAAGRVRLGLFDVNGRRVASVLSGDWLEAGRHQRVLDTSRFSPGVYWTRLEFGGRIQVRSLTIRP
ncbi:MAG: T9SS type A sorting domain-containing protein [Candidatus Eisenbacteria bacterium]|nr:T9SS type A sorting domain-containing protein [Candidatus Eisenbacteria bacterium]